MAAARDVALDPVRARPAARASDWPWSSVRAHLQAGGDGLVDVNPQLGRLDGRFDDLFDGTPRPSAAHSGFPPSTTAPPPAPAATPDRTGPSNPRTRRPGRAASVPRTCGLTTMADVS